MGPGLKSLARDWHGCQRCQLGKERTGQSIVFGAGRSTAKYLLIYDVPTGSDVATGRPMSGDAGNLLVELLEEAKIATTDVYCAPLVGCRPLRYPAETSDSPAMMIDRAPEKEELQACRARIDEIIYRVDPMLIFTLGDTAWKSLVKGKNRNGCTSLDKAVGDLFLTTIAGRWAPELTYDVVPLMSMQQLMQKPSFAVHGPLFTTAKHLHKGRVFVEYLERTGKRDAESAGFGPEETQP
jgi:uracil-DNA glycosylase family 4